MSHIGCENVGSVVCRDGSWEVSSYLSTSHDTFPTVLDLLIYVQKPSFVFLLSFFNFFGLFSGKLKLTTTPLPPSLSTFVVYLRMFRSLFDISPFLSIRTTLLLSLLQKKMFFHGFFFKFFGHFLLTSTNGFYRFKKKMWRLTLWRHHIRHFFFEKNPEIVRWIFIFNIFFPPSLFFPLLPFAFLPFALLLPFHPSSISSSPHPFDVEVRKG